jgi:hypothetical protein
MKRFMPLVLGFLSVACGYDNGDRVHADDARPGPVYATIDTDAKLSDVESGVGVFIEYATGGVWTLKVGCDTATTDQTCEWDIRALTPEGVPISSMQALDLESSDWLSVASDGVVQLVTTTGDNLDGVTFTTIPDKPIEFDVLLKDESYPERFVFFVSGGEVTNGIDSPVFELTPAAAVAAVP